MPAQSVIDEPDEKSEINLSPMIDCIFILLIFFIVTTVFVEKPEVDIIKPNSAYDEDLAKNSIIFAVTKDSKVVYGAKEISIPMAGATVRQLLTENNYPVIIQGDVRADFGVIKDLYTETNNAGAQVKISTRNN